MQESTAQPVDFEEGMLDVGEGHTIYWRAQGPRDMPPMLVVHGGPGGAMNVKWAEVLDASKWRIVFFDQRGCGKSTPFGKLEHNGIDALVGDMEKLRVALGIDKWALFGGSWGTTLGLAYGIAHPGRCLGFLLRGVFLARREDIDWFLWDVRRVFPDAHRRFLDAIEAACGRRPRSAAEILTLAEAPLARFDDAGARLARAWTAYETTLSVVNKPAPAPEKPAEEKKETGESNAPAISMALLERHYMANELPPEPLLPRVPAIAHLPCHIVHGRFDMVCPADQALELAEHWPGAELSIVDAAGHWTFEPGNVAALRASAEALSKALA
ncbi:prolyl aminopeptidase [Caballeronia sp. LZ024]|uniref:prolyl aminopeptidase n=1 Tax=Caballeronia sp. LZ024 TaxID=3038561 RepID=UPI002865CCD6|nr:prolyl aminopeptidase [Caballeronia sp. LZ024]MDR5753624.1 prolyl aminopeptidase [Caballeronia sp. LZ024]